MHHDDVRALIGQCNTIRFPGGVALTEVDQAQVAGGVLLDGVVLLQHERREVALVVKVRLVPQFPAVFRIQNEALVIPVQLEVLLETLLLIRKERLAGEGPTTIGPTSTLELKQPEVDTGLDLFAAVPTDNLANRNLARLEVPILQNRPQVAYHRTSRIDQRRKRAYIQQIRARGNCLTTGASVLMRVISGTYRGRRLVAPVGRTTRPITDGAKEAVFNILGHRFGTPGALPAVEVLDIFAGTGGLGIEAVSRGASRCTFVERNPRALRALRENLRQLGLSKSCRVLTDNAWSMRFPPTPDGYGVVFFDPPYRDVESPLRIIDVLERVAAQMRADGVVVFRFDSRTEFPTDQLRRLRCADEREISRMRILLLTRADAADLRDSVAYGAVGDVARGEQIEKENRPDEVGDDADR